jgi:hypothetical protein
MLEYRELNSPQALSDADNKFRQELEEQEKLSSAIGASIQSSKILKKTWPTARRKFPTI